MTIHEEIFEEFCEWLPEYVPNIKEYKPWGSTSIVVWLKDGLIYKVKRFAPKKFIMQMVSKEDVERKFNGK